MENIEEISIIIPAYNEEKAILDVIENIKNNLSGKYLYELIVVDDGSKDKTAEIARGAGVKVVSNPTNMGYGFSLKRGFREAKNECVIITDADGTYPIDKIPALVEEFKKGFDMVVGARQGKEYWSSKVKTFARLCFKWMSEFVAGKKIADINSGFRAIRRSKILPFLPDLSNKFSFTASSTLIFFLQHYFIKYIPIEYYERKGKTKVKYVHDALITTQIMVDIIAKYNPIKLFLLVSFLPLLLAIVFLLLCIFCFKDIFFTSMLVSFFFAILLVSLGFIATIFRRA